MNRIWRQNPLLRICTPLLIGVYLCNDYRSTLFYFCTALLLFIIFFCSKKIVWISGAFFFMFIAVGSSWNALIAETTPTTLCPTDWEPLEKKENPLSLKIKNKLQYYYSNDELGIIIAFLVGDTAYLSHHLKDQYKAIGISHLLAVSGMHIGLLFGLIYWLLKKITFNYYPNWTTIISLACIWIFCYFCQFPPSLNRAAIMFTFLHLGKIFLKKTHAINLLCLSLIIQVAWNPADKENWGLILSHLAVLGIVFFHRPIQLQIKHWRKIPKLIVENIAVTIHAQWSTGLFLLPLTTSFPTYFLIANLILVPISSGLLYLIFLLMVIPNHWNITYLHDIIKGCIHFMNRIVLEINQWPMPQLNFVDWSWVDNITWLMTGLGFYYLWNRNYRKSIILSLFGLTIWTFQPYLIRQNEIELHLWRHKGQPCILYKTINQNFYLGPKITHNFIPTSYTPVYIQ